MILKRFDLLQPKDGRETIFLSPFGSSKGIFKEDVRVYANGLLNSHGGIIYFGIKKNGTIMGSKITRKEEDEYRLVVDHTFGSFQPFVKAEHYRLSFIPVTEGSGTPKYTVIELKVSVGVIGEVYEDGLMKVYLIDETRLVGPLYPQELKELILLKYKESLEGVEEAAKFATPNILAARAKAKREQEQKKNNKTSLSDIPEEPHTSASKGAGAVTGSKRQRTGEELKTDTQHSKKSNRTLVSYANYDFTWF